MAMSPKEYDVLAKKASPNSPIGKNVLWAFLVGGAICTLGQALCQESHSLQIVQSHGLHIEPNPAWGHCPGDSTF